MWFHLWLPFNGYESVTDLSWFFRQQGLLLFALLPNLMMDKMAFVTQTATNVPIQLHSSLQKVYSREADVTLIFYMKILYVFCFHDDLVKPSAWCFDNFLLGENCQIPYNSFFLVRFLPYYFLRKPSTANETVLGIPGWMVFFCLLDFVAFFFFSVICSMYGMRLSGCKFPNTMHKKRWMLFAILTALKSEKGLTNYTEIFFNFLYIPEHLDCSETNG